MDSRDLYNSLQELDDEILERSEGAARRSKSPAWLKWGAAAACLCLIAAAALPRFLSDKPAPGPDLPSLDGPMIEPSVSMPPVPHYGPTSDTYSDLSQLLAHLSTHDSHNSRQDITSKGSGVSSLPSGTGSTERLQLVENTGVAVTTDGRYAYHIGEEEVWISRLEGGDTKNAGSIDVSANAVFVCNDHLLVISEYQSGGNELDREMSVRVGIYDLTSPQEPVLLDEYIQRGSLSACWMSGADLYLVTGDGACACGWSRLSDPAGYFPALSRSGEAIGWTDSDISILGQPTRVRYAAITVINGNSRELVSKEALYGDISGLFYGADWIAAVVEGETASVRENPMVYTFDRMLDYTGKIDTAQVMDAPRANVLKDFAPQNGTYLRVSSLTKQNGIYRILGTCTIRQDAISSPYFMAIAANTETGEAAGRRLYAKDYPHGSFTEILWEKDRAVACVGTWSGDTGLEQSTRFLFVEFQGLKAAFYENRLTAAYLDGRVGATYGDPLGKFQTLIPLGGGIYARYSEAERGPGGFDLFDFSDSAAPLCLYCAKASLSGGDAFDYLWQVYDEHTFGTLKVLLGADDYFRNVDLAWCVYTVDPSGAVALQSEHSLDKKVRSFFGADALGLVVFHAGDELYYAAKDMTAAVPLG